MNRLWVRLSLTFTVVVLFGVLAIAAVGFLMTDLTVRRHFLVMEIQNPGGLIDTLGDYYRTHQTWEGVDPLLAGAQAAFPVAPNGGLALFLTDEEGHIIYQTKPWTGRQPRVENDLRDTIPVRVDGRTTGYLGVEFTRRIPPPPPPPDVGRGDEPRLALSESAPSPGRFFLHSMSRALWWVALFIGVLGILFGISMSRSLTAPLSRLAETAKAIGAGDFSRRVEATGSAEMIEVAQAFNEMIDDLKEAEALRRNLIADVAHELRTPLSVLRGNLQAILDGVYPLDQAEIARLYDQTRLLGRLVEDLHELAQAEARQLPLNVQPTDVCKLAQETVETFGPAAELEGVTLTFEASPGVFKANVDPARVTQVLHNLLANALQHTPPGGSVAVRVSRNGDDVLLEVQDTGEGIATEDLPHVFDRFYRADRSRARGKGGAGLGLAISKALVEAHGGKVSVASGGIPGQGSTFTVHLPGERADPRFEPSSD